MVGIDEIEIYLKGRNIPKLTKDQVTLLNAPISALEIEQTIKRAKSDKGAGPNGLSTLYYQVF